MTLEALRDAKKVVGVKQVTKAVGKGLAKRVFFAADADARVLHPLKVLCAEKEVELLEADSMRTLGKACGIEVGAAAVAVLDSPC